MDTVMFYSAAEVGVASLGRVAVRQSEEGFEARLGVLLALHATSTDIAQLSIANPFEDGAVKDYLHGKGKTSEEALQALRDKARSYYS